MSKKSRQNRKRQREINYVHASDTQVNYNYGDAMWYKNCHNGPVEVFSIGTSNIYAGSQWEIDTSLLSIDLFICANGTKGQFNTMINITDTRGLLKATHEEVDKRLTPTFLTLDIPDGAAPSLGPRFWKCLVSDIRDKRLNIAIYCQGGHGRTGTILACLAHYGGLVTPPNDVVKFIRNVYCSEAVETSEQLTYLRQLGMTTNEEMSLKPVARIGQVYVPDHKVDSIQTNTGLSWNAETGEWDQVPVTSTASIIEGSNGVEAVIKSDDIPVAERQTTQEELMEWERELIQDAERKAERERLEGGMDYAG